MIESFIEETNRAKSRAEVLELYLKAMQQFGYDRVNYCYVTDQPDINQQAEFGLESTYPKEWLERYEEQNYLHVDPPFLHAMKFNGPFTWASLVKMWEYSPVQNQINDEANVFQMFKGAAVAIHGRFGGLSGVGIASSYDKEMPTSTILRKIDLLTRQFHYVYSIHNDQSKRQKEIQLSEREREILLWASEGKSDTVIEDLIGIKHSTIRYHWGNIFKKLGVNERTLAVVKAIKIRLITPNSINARY